MAVRRRPKNSIKNLKTGKKNESDSAEETKTSESDSSNSKKSDPLKEAQGLGVAIYEEAKRYIGRMVQKDIVADQGTGPITPEMFIYGTYHNAGIDIGSQSSSFDVMFKYLTDTKKHKTFENEANALIGDIICYYATVDGKASTNVGFMGVFIGQVKGENENEVKVVDHYSIQAYLNDKVSYVPKEKDKNASVKKIFIRISDYYVTKKGEPVDISKTKLSSNSGRASDSGFRVVPTGPETVKITILPANTTYCEPIYPDLITVSDTIPAWMMVASADIANSHEAASERKAKQAADKEAQMKAEAAGVAMKEKK